MQALGVTAGEIDITAAARQMLADIGHPYAGRSRCTTSPSRTCRPGERTDYLFRLANLHGGLVVGTGDLSELALGWCTYGVGDHMSHYNVNASVPKTLIQHLIRWSSAAASSSAHRRRSCAHPRHRISPELVPATARNAAAVDGSRGRSVRPAGLQSLLPEPLRLPADQGGLSGARTRGATRARRVAGRGAAAERRAYDLPTIRRLAGAVPGALLRDSQFKRSALPNGPKMGSGGSLSPRGDWRAPSDAPATRGSTSSARTFLRDAAAGSDQAQALDGALLARRPGSACSVPVQLHRQAPGAPGPGPSREHPWNPETALRAAARPASVPNGRAGTSPAR